jgi:hypothetical protein
MREEIAARQRAEYDACLELARRAFGPGWEPSHRHFLQDRDEEDRCRRTRERPRAAATVYTVKNAAGEQRHFTVSGDGKVTECESYQAGFGPMLFEPHPTRTIELGGRTVRPHRYSLCWSGYELYHPKTAEQLASLRAGRERGRAERAAKKWAEDHPLLAWAEKERQAEEGSEAQGQGR